MSGECKTIKIFVGGKSLIRAYFFCMYDVTPAENSIRKSLPLLKPLSEDLLQQMKEEMVHVHEQVEA